MFPLIFGCTVVDCLLYLSAGFLRADHVAVTWSIGLSTIYWTSAVAGLMACVYGFVRLLTGGSPWLQRAVLCVLCSFIPACGALIGILSHIGTTPI